MKILNVIIVSLMSLLSISAGFAKIMQVPQEMTFLISFGLSTTTILIFGIVQVIGGLLLAIPKTRLVGATLIIIAFLLSTILVLLSGNLPFGLVSMLPLAATGWVIYQTLDSTHSKEYRETTL